MVERIDWKKLIKIDQSWHTDVLNHQFSRVNGKVRISMHSISSTGTQVRSDLLVTKLARLVPQYVLGEKKTRALESPMDIAHHSIKYFGDIDPEKDGKYGELMLFALVEAMLDCKMVAHKILALSSGNDQVKGGDGIFLGDYEVNGTLFPACLIGESKVVAKFSSALGDAFSSIYRMHDPSTSQKFRDMEWFVAANHLVEDDDVDIDGIYDRLNPESDTFSRQNLVHPILLMYNQKDISEVETKAVSKENFEVLLKEKLVGLTDGIVSSINDQISKYPEIKSVFLHFFVIPFNDVGAFRHGMYQRLHHSEYRPKSEK